jgi:hypothetical protein
VPVIPRAWVAGSILGVSLLLLAVEVFVMALPSLPHAWYGGRLVAVGEWACSVLAYMSWIAFGYAACATAACWYFRPAGLALRLARGIALGVALFHFFMAPGVRTYGRLLWGAC